MTGVFISEDGAQGMQGGSSTAGLRSEADWQSFFGNYPHIVLVANSDEVLFDEVRSAYPPSTLFVFFNYVNKVLKAPFAGNSLLVTRSSRIGSEFVHDNTLGKMLGFLPQPGFTGLISLRVANMELLSEPAEFGNVAAGAMDICDYFHDFYPPEHTASSGFALAVWLCEKVPQSRVALAGFSGKRSRKWKMFHIHDWTFEQSVLRVLANTGRLEIAGSAAFNPYKALSRHFPDIGTNDISLAAVQVLSERLENSNRQVDKLITITMPFRVIYNLVWGLRIRSKKDRLVKKRKRQRDKSGTPSQKA